MPDYKAVLGKTLSGLGDKSTPEIRQRVYDKARSAIAKQLEAASASLTQERMDAEKKKLEDAIVDLEAEFQPAPIAAPATEPEPEVSPTAFEDNTGLEKAKDIANDAKSSAVAAGAVDAGAGALEGASDLADGAISTTKNVAKDAADSIGDAAAKTAELASDISSSATANVADAGSAIGVGASDIAQNIGNGVNSVAGATTAIVGGAGAAATSTISDGLSGLNPSDADKATQYSERKPKRKMGWVWLLFFLCLIGGGAFAAVQNKPAVEEFLAKYAPGVDLSFLGFESSVSQEDSNAQSASVTQDENKEESEGDDTQASAEPNGEADKVPENLIEQPDDVVTKVQEQQEAEQAEESQSQENQSAADDSQEFNARLTPENDAQAQEQTDPANLSESDAEKPTDGSDAQALIAQRAFFYIEGETPDDATRANGAVFWKNGERDGLPTIEGDIQVDGVGIKGRFIISKNTSPDLSASHLIEVLFDVPEDFSGRSIDAIGRPLFKVAEDDAGNALMSQVARIDDGKFFVALFQAKEALDVNLPLLTDTAWIGIPATYATGRRVLLNLEKGALGDQVFSKAILAWQQ